MRSHTQVVYDWKYKNTPVRIIVHTKRNGKKVSYHFTYRNKLYSNVFYSVLGAWDEARLLIDDLMEEYND